MTNSIISFTCFSRLFDREKQSKYSFKVIAQDNAQYDPRTNQTWVDVTILDVNDNAPVFVEVPFVKNITGLETGTILTVSVNMFPVHTCRG